MFSSSSCFVLNPLSRHEELAQYAGYKLLPEARRSGVDGRRKTKLAETKKHPVDDRLMNSYNFAIGITYLPCSGI